MKQLIEHFAELTGLSPSVAVQLLATGATVVALFILRIVITGLIRRYGQDAISQYRARRGTSYVLTLIGVVIVGRIWVPGMDSVATFIGLVGAGLAVAMHDTISNLTGWLFIMGRRPFSVGDRIEINGSAGDVIDIRLFQFSMLEIRNWVDADQSTGRIVHVPNGVVLRERLATYTGGFHYIWNEVEVPITFESNWRKAKRILEEIAAREDVSEEARRRLERVTDKYVIYFANLTPIVYTAVRDSGIVLTARILCPVRQRRGLEQRVWEAILDAFAKEEDIAFAYPTTRFFEGSQEGKPGTGGPAASRPS